MLILSIFSRPASETDSLSSSVAYTKHTSKAIDVSSSGLIKTREPSDENKTKHSKNNSQKASDGMLYVSINWKEEGCYTYYGIAAPRMPDNFLVI